MAAGHTSERDHPVPPKIFHSEKIVSRHIPSNTSSCTRLGSFTNSHAQIVIATCSSTSAILKLARNPTLIQRAVSTAWDRVTTSNRSCTTVRRHGQGMVRLPLLDGSTAARQRISEQQNTSPFPISASTGEAMS